MRILICGLNFAPELVGVGKYTGEAAAWLAARGHDVKVIAAPPYYPQWRRADGYSRWRYKKETISGVRVIRCPIYVPARPTSISRLIHLFSFAITTLPAMLAQILWRPDVVISIEPALMSAPGSWLTARLCGAKSWLHIQDFEVAAAFRLGILSRFKSLEKVACAIEGWIMRRFDAVSAISGKMVQRSVSANRVRPERAIQLSNWASLDRTVPENQILGDARAFRTSLACSGDDLVLLYSGNMGQKQGLELILEVAEMSLPDPKIRFILAGEGGTKSIMVAEATRRALTNITFLPLQAEETFPAMLAAADIHLVVQKAEAADLVLPSKVTNILAAGKAMIVTAGPDTELGQMADMHDFALRVTPSSATDLMNAILELAQSRHRRERMGASARLYAQNELDKEQILLKLESQLIQFQKGLE